MTFERTSQHVFFGTSALLFAASASLTILWCGSMSAMGAMPMPGGWKMSMAWMPMPGQTWVDAAASFIGMWVVMMIAMMLPSMAPTLWRYCQSASRTGEVRTNWLTALVTIGYFVVWTVFGIVVFPLGATLAQFDMDWPARARDVPIAVGVVIVLTGAVQFTAWKAHHLASCRKPTASHGTLPADAATALQHGMRLGLHCVFGCAGFTAILLVAGVMDLRVMALVTAAITAERLAPNRARVARAIGIVVIGIGLLLISRATAGTG
jgi:predicted metal-binding membrane protein